MNFSIVDETFSGQILKTIDLDIDKELITVGDLIKLRVTKEIEEKVQKYKELQLIDCTEASPLLDSQSYIRIEEEMAKRVRNETARALKAFQQNSFFVFIGDRQVQTLNFTISLSKYQKASFIKLLPLVGG